jgi:DNA repair exonuclease SbcCD nuclease subunit
MKVLRCGDPHITVRNLDEATKLLAFILEMARKYNVERIEFLGDLMHTHAVIRVEVLDFWANAFKQLGREFAIVSLVGNHDQPGSKEKEQQMNGLNIFKSKSVRIVNAPTIIENVAYIPYMSDREAFIAAAQSLYDQGATELLVAHQNFTIPLYSDMIDQNLVPQKAIITGHIHEQKQIGKTFQVGTPKWDTMSDANEPKGIWIYEHNEKDGSVKSKIFLTTEEIVTPIQKYVMNEGDPEVTMNPKANNYLQFVGSTAWITQMKKKYKGMASISAKPSDRKNLNVNKDKSGSVLDFLNSSFTPIDGVSKEEIKTYIEEVVNV